MTIPTREGTRAYSDWNAGYAAALDADEAIELEHD